MTDPRVAAGDADMIVVQRPVDDPGGFATVLQLSRTLRVGDRVTVRVSVAIDGEYEIGTGTDRGHGSTGQPLGVGQAGA